MSSDPTPEGPKPESHRSGKRDKRADADYQRAVGEFANREVVYCVSGLVYEIGREKIDEWHHLFVQEDWETPALEAIRALSPELLRDLLEQGDVQFAAKDGVDAIARTYLLHLKQKGSVREFCEANHLDPHHNEIYEHWIVSAWLADHLEDRGEVIERDFYSLTVWGRACTGQAILLDDVICSIYDEVAL
jgi:hypothetical protein